MKIPVNYMEYLKSHKDCDQSTVEYAKDLCPGEIELSLEVEKTRIRHMVYNVQHEIQKLTGLVRLSPLGETILYGYISPEHDIGLHVAKSFAERFPGRIIVLGNRKASWLSFDSGEETVNLRGGWIKETLDQLKAVLEINAIDGVNDLSLGNYYRTTHPEKPTYTGSFNNHAREGDPGISRLDTWVARDNLKLTDYL